MTDLTLVMEGEEHPQQLFGFGLFAFRPLRRPQVGLQQKRDEALEVEPAGAKLLQLGLQPG
jgi:hypothetical protein